MALSFRIDTRHHLIVVRSDQRLVREDLITLVSTWAHLPGDELPCRIADLREVTVCTPTAADVHDLIRTAHRAGREFPRTAIVTGNAPVRILAQALESRLPDIKAFVDPEQASTWLGIECNWDPLDALRAGLGRRQPQPAASS